MSRLAVLAARLRVLATRRADLSGGSDGTPSERLTWSEAWAVTGIHPCGWRWVRRYSEPHFAPADDVIAALESIPGIRRQGTRAVVIAPTRDGFDLPEEAEAELRARGHDHPRLLARDHPDLVEVVRLYGDASGALDEWTGLRARIVIIDIPADIDWIIQRCDGAEWVAQEHRRWDWQGEVEPGQAVTFLDD